MSLTIREATLDDIDLLTAWRMTVLREVFSVPDSPWTNWNRKTAGTIRRHSKRGRTSPALLMTMMKWSAAAAYAFTRKCHRPITPPGNAPI